MSFVQGLATGLASSVDKRLQDDMERTYNKIEKTSALRAKTIVEGSTLHESEFKKYKDSLGSISSIVGNDMDLVDYLVDQAGGDVEIALDKAQTLKDAVDNSAGKFTAYDLLNIERRQGDSPRISATQIARRIHGTYVPPPDVSGEMAVGLNALFMRKKDISGAINKETDQLLSSAGINFDKGDTNTSYMDTLTSQGERTKLISAYSEDDSSKRAYKFAELGANLTVMAADPNLSEIQREEIECTISLAKYEVTIHKAIKENLKLDAAGKELKSFTINEYNSHYNTVITDLNRMVGVDLTATKKDTSVSLRPQDDTQVQKVVNNFKIKDEGIVLTNLATRITNDLNYINSYQNEHNEESFFEENRNVVFDVRTDIFRILAEGKDYELNELLPNEGDDFNPIIEAVPRRINEVSESGVSRNDMLERDPQMLYEEIETSNTELFARAFPDGMFTDAPTMDAKRFGTGQFIYTDTGVISSSSIPNNVSFDDPVQEIKNAKNNAFPQWRSNNPEGTAQEWLKAYMESNPNTLLGQMDILGSFTPAASSANSVNDGLTTTQSTLFGMGKPVNILKNGVIADVNITYKNVKIGSSNTVSTVNLISISTDDNGIVSYRVAVDGKETVVSENDPVAIGLGNAGFILQQFIDSLAEEK